MYVFNDTNDLPSPETVPRDHFTTKSLYNEVLLVFSNNLLDGLQDKSIVNLVLLQDGQRYGKIPNASQE